MDTARVHGGQSLKVGTRAVGARLGHMDSGVKPGQVLSRTNWTSSPTVRRLCVRSSSSASSALPRRQVCCISGLVSCRIQPVRKGRARGTAAWLCGDAGGSHLSAPIRGEVASKSKPSPSPKMSSRTLTAPGAMGTSKSSCKGGARGGHSHSWRLRRTEPATFDIFPRRLVAFHPAAQRTSGRRSTWLSLVC